MGARAEILAREFEQTNGEVIALIERCSDAQLRAFCPAEQCTVAALGCHIGEAHETVAGWVRLAAAGRALPSITWAMIDAQNAVQVAGNAYRSKAEVLGVLRRTSAEAERLVRRLSDEELDRVSPFDLFEGAPITTQALIEGLFTYHAGTHLASLRAVTGLLPVRAPRASAEIAA